MSALGRAGSNPVVSTTDRISSLKLECVVVCFERLEKPFSREHNYPNQILQGFKLIDAKNNLLYIFIRLAILSPDIIVMCNHFDFYFRH